MKWLFRRWPLDRILRSLFLRLKGYHIVAQRYETPVGLIDFVALKDKRLAFIEVKRRKISPGGAFTLPAKQRRRVLRAAQYWLSSNPNLTGHRIAFDVLLAPHFGWPRHITNAFPNAEPA